VGSTGDLDAGPRGNLLGFELTGSVAVLNESRLSLLHPSTGLVQHLPERRGFLVHRLGLLGVPSSRSVGVGLDILVEVEEPVESAGREVP
jgi:hypothetical protein